jgi:hypothetical protein
MAYFLTGAPRDSGRQVLGNAGQQYLTGNPLSPDVRFVQNGPAMDGWTPPARSATAEEPTIGAPGGRGGRGGGSGR